MKKTLLTCLAIIPLILFAQDDTLATKRQLRKNQAQYFVGTIGIGTSSIRDFATSPLFYTGAPFHFELTRLRMGKQDEMEYGASFDFGTYFNNVSDLEWYSSFSMVSVFFSKLFPLQKLSNERFDTKIGGLYSIAGTIRVNERLQNNSYGSEMFFNLMASIKTQYDISRLETKSKKFLFIRYTQKPRKRTLGARLNVGLINSTLRNGYIYTNQSPIVNDSFLYDGYEFKAFSGMRLGFDFDYTWFLNNHNGLKLSYNWDALTTGGDLDQFNMAFHTIGFSLLFNTNNK